MTIPIRSVPNIEELLRLLTAGDVPEENETIVFTGEDGWLFRTYVGENQTDIIVVNQSGTDLEGTKLLLWKALNAELSGGEPKIIPRAPHNLGNITGTVTLDYDNGGTQKGTLTGNVTIDGVNNLDEGGWMNLRFSTGGNTLDFDATAFEGPNLSFTDSTVWVSIVDFQESKLAAIGGGS